ncbi:YqiA/YcfP family alpha/beta fold hydrolase [Pseudoalteromonas sp. S16_S37]|uniref:YqiA/YcfP family alpha/beta fold hydrolase n=1 Tax=Pseudoalteromonas sp. S16_S37 TaxID=2720228 RepID=UPI001681A9C6|nr:YqiA/YcfP family alpha/beta fold hydrolase [Pseudoalteromonas sp. S16_S37]MBD1580886.1 esterase YqiA [Pseudoalteromonas sp. S16_S37]
MVKRVIYIHGFNSSELSAKAQQFGAWLAQQPLSCEYITPRLHFDPRVAIMQLESVINEQTVLLGSSLGGFYATYLSQQYNLPAVVINPAVRPFELLADYLGAQYNPYQQIHYHLEHEHVHALKQLYVAQLTKPELLMLLQQMGDEVLPYQQALQYYQACQQRIDFAGDHSFMDFQRYFDTVVNFLKIT